MKKRALKDLDVAGKRVLVRVGVDVPMDDTCHVTDTRRLRDALPTISHLRKQGASVILFGHAGRPKGNVVESLRLKGVAKALSELIGTDVSYVDEVSGDKASAVADALKPGDVMLLENVRFDPREKVEKDVSLADEWASMADAYVLEAFSNSHRDQTSMTGFAGKLPTAMGLGLEHELTELGKTVENPERPLGVIMGGVKMETRVPMIRHFFDNVGADVILLGGAMANTFFHAQGHEIGDSLHEPDYADVAKELIDAYGDKLVLPADVVIAPDLERADQAKMAWMDKIPDGVRVLDVGPATIDRFEKAVAGMKTLVWNGPMGVFEIDAFFEGTRRIAQIVANHPAKTIIGGGDTVAAIEKAGLEDKMDFISTGGGAALTFFEGKPLPAVEALDDAA